MCLICESPVDRAKALAKEYGQERMIALSVATDFALARQTLWRIRSGQIRRSPAAVAYHQRLKDANIRPLELLKRDHPRDGKWAAMA